MKHPVAVGSHGESKKLFVYLTCLYILTWYLQLNQRVGLLGAIRFEFFLGSFLSAGALVTYFTSPGKKSPLFGPVFFFLGVLTCYTLFSYDSIQSWYIYIDRVVKFSMLALFLSMFIRTPWALKMAMGAFFLAMMKLGQEGFVGWWTGSQMWQNQGVMRLHGSSSMYNLPNSFSGMAVGCLPFIYYLYPTVTRLWKSFLLILLLFCAVIIVFTASREGYVATLGLGVVFFIKSRGAERFRYLVLAIIIAVGAVAIAPAAYKERFGSIFMMKDKEGASTEKRIQIMVDAVQLYCAHPLGVGVAAFPFVREKMFGRSQEEHNLYFQLLTNLGPLGLVAFLLLIYRILWTNRELQKQMESIYFDDKSFFLAVSKAVVAFIYARLFLGLFGSDTYEIYWWFAVGLTSSLWAIIQNLKVGR